jgi:rubrerythrin
MTTRMDEPTSDGSEETTRIGFGKPVFDGEGNRLGKVRGFDHGGFYVTMREGYESMSVEHVRSDGEFGEAELMWRCMECGEMGRIEDGLPEACPNCDEPRESLMYWTED